MAEINSFPIESVKVSELATLGVTSESLMAHQIGDILYKETLENITTYISGVIGTTDAIGFLPISVNDGDTLPALPTYAGFFLAGQGTYHNVSGAPDIVCVEKLNAIMTDPTLSFWVLSVEIPIDVQTEYIGISQLIRPDVVNLAPSEKAVYDALAEIDLQSVLNEGNVVSNATNTLTIDVDRVLLEYSFGDINKNTSIGENSIFNNYYDYSTNENTEFKAEAFNKEVIIVEYLSSIITGFAKLISKFSTFGGALQIGKGADYTATIITDTLTQDNLHTLPNKSGTIAHLPEISDDFINDAAAASGGIAIGGLYHTAGVVKIRLT